MRSLVLVSALTLVACAPTTSQKADAPREGSTCFLPSQVDSFAAQDINTVNIRVNQDYYRLTLAEHCPEVGESDRIQLIPRAGTGRLTCIDEVAETTVVAHSKLTGPKRCLVRTMQLLTPTEVAGLSPKEKP